MYPILPIPLNFRDLVPKVFNKNPVSPFDSAVRFRVECSGVNSLYSKQFESILKHLA